MILPPTGIRHPWERDWLRHGTNGIAWWHRGGPGKDQELRDTRAKPVGWAKAPKPGVAGSRCGLARCAHPSGAEGWKMGPLRLAHPTKLCPSMASPGRRRGTSQDPDRDPAPISPPRHGGTQPPEQLDCTSREVAGSAQSDPTYALEPGGVRHWRPGAGGDQPWSVPYCPRRPQSFCLVTEVLRFQRPDPPNQRNRKYPITPQKNRSTATRPMPMPGCSTARSGRVGS